MDRICFERPTFNMYLFILVCIISYLLYFKLSEHYQDQIFDPYANMSRDKLYDKVLEIKDSLHDVQLKEQKCQMELSFLKNNSNSTNSTSTQNKFLSKIYNPLSPPENVYPGGSFNSQGYDGYQNYQMLGYLTGPQGRYPVMGRYRDAGRTDRFQYYTIDNERGRIKIPFKIKQDNELYDGDPIVIPELDGEFTFKKYKDEGSRYNPNV